HDALPISIPSPTGQAVTGMSDSLSLGDISALSESTELAFRVEFLNEPPAQEELYWRGVVLGEFDGKSWRAERRTRSFVPQQQAMPAWWQEVNSLTAPGYHYRSEEHTSELQSRFDLVCRLLLEKKKGRRLKQRL